MAISTKNKKRCPKKSSSTQAQKRVICSKRGCNNKARIQEDYVKGIVRIDQIQRVAVIDQRVM